MDLIYTNSFMQDIGVMSDYELDLAFGQDENNLECQIQASSHCCKAGYYLYIEGTEYGGIVDSIETDTGAGTISYEGRTWHGILGSKIIMPLMASDSSSGGVTIKTVDSGGSSLYGKYLVISGDANACLKWLIDRIGVSALFQGNPASCGTNITEYQFNRFTDAYSGIIKMLASANLKLNITFSNGHVVLSASSKQSFTSSEFNSDQVDFVLKKKYKTVNHLVCLGSGELNYRTVIHLYADSSGNISQTQTMYGMDEVMETFDYPSAESTAELILKGTERLNELIDSTEMTVDCDESDDDYDVGDTVGAYDEITQMSVSAPITKKIVTVKDGKITIQYKVGE